MARHQTAWVYGELQGEPPYIGGSSDSVSRIIPYSIQKAGPLSIPSSGVNFWELSPAISIGGVNCNAVIEILPTGLNIHSRKYATDASVDTLNTGAA